MDLAKRLDRPVVLVGLMGVGKSTVGRRLAKRLGLPFVDSDDEIEDAAGFPPPRCSNATASSDFRDGERRLVARLIEGEMRVIATGGGAYVDRSNAQAAQRTRHHDLARRAGRHPRRAHVAPRHPRPASHRRPEGDAGASLGRATPVIRRSAYSREKRRRRAPGSGRCHRPRPRRAFGRVGP